MPCRSGEERAPLEHKSRDHANRDTRRAHQPPPELAFLHLIIPNRVFKSAQLSHSDYLHSISFPSLF
jgi:hypothetical protein